MDWRHFEDILNTFSVRFPKCTIDRTSLCKAAGPHHHAFFPLGSRGEPQRHSDSAPQSGLWPLRLSVLIYSDCLFLGDISLLRSPRVGSSCASATHAAFLTDLRFLALARC